MWSEAKKLAFLKTLSAIAWADGELDNEELNYLKHLALKFSLSNSNWTKLKPCLEDFIPPDEGEKLLREYLGRINTPGEKQELLNALEEMVRADERITPQERELLDKFSQIIRDTSAVGIMLDKLKGLLPDTLFKHAKDESGEAADFIHNKLLRNIRRRFSKQGMQLEQPLDKLNYLVLFGGLLARVAYAEGDISPVELNYLKRKLSQLAKFKSEELELLVAVIEDKTLEGLDYFRLTAEFFKVSDRKGRLDLLDCLFALAGADEQLLSQEVEEIRSIAYALGLSHKDFINAKLKYLYGDEPA
jgi:uncharacterized tellurite resistance protein B-like protein